MSQVDPIPNSLLDTIKAYPLSTSLINWVNSPRRYNFKLPYIAIESFRQQIATCYEADPSIRNILVTSAAGFMFIATPFVNTMKLMDFTKAEAGLPTILLDSIRGITILLDTTI